MNAIRCIVTLLLVATNACSDPQCGDGEFKIADTCYKRGAPRSDASAEQSPIAEDAASSRGAAGVDAGPVEGLRQSDASADGQMEMCDQDGALGCGQTEMCSRSDGYCAPKDRDDCLAKPCLNGGVCSDLAKDFSCECRGTGFDGKRCDHNIDDCVSMPCLNGGSCTDGLKSRTCACADGFFGADCEAETCRDVSVRSLADLQAAQSCAEIHGSLDIAASGLPAITVTDFPHLTKVTGDLRVSANLGAVSTPPLRSITLSGLQSIGGALIVGELAEGQVAELRLPELVTIGASDNTEEDALVISEAQVRVVELPKLETIHGRASLAILPKLCTLNVRRVERITGNAFFLQVPNVPSSVFTVLRDATKGTVTATAIGCCSLASALGCESLPLTGVCGC